MRRFSSRRAFTLVELLFVLVTISVVAAIGFGSVRDMMPRFRMVKTGKDLRQDVSMLRVTALETGLETRLLLVDADSSWSDPATRNVGSWKLQVGNKSRGSTSWETFPADAAEDGTDDETAQGTVDISRGGQDEADDVSLVPWTGISNDAIVFSPRGFVSNPDSDFGSSGYIELTLINKHALTDDVEDTVVLNIARSGSVTMTSALGKRDAGSVGTSATSTSN